MLPRTVASEVMTAAVSRAAWAVAVVVLLLDVPVAVDTLLQESSGDQLLLPLMALVGMLALLAYTRARPGLRSRVIFLAGGALLAGLYQLGILAADPGILESGTYLVNRPAFVLVLVAQGIVRPLDGLRWSAIGYVVSMTTLLVTDVIAGAPLITGWGPTMALIICSTTYALLAGIRASQGAQLPDLQKLEVDTRAVALAHQYEQRAAAVIHDTVLNDLSVVMNSSGSIDERVRSRFRADVATLSDAAWLRETRDLVEPAGTDAALRNEIVTLISEMQWKGLTVDLTGGSDDEIARLSPENISTASAAVRACLENVLKHAETTSVEVVLSAAAGSVTIMVIDQGVGFTVESVAGGRLGLRVSVVRRVEGAGGSVRIWSKPGSGTSVMISLPSETTA